MLEIQEDRSKEAGKSVLLSSVNPRGVVRFADVSFGDALKNDGFYLVVESPNSEGRKDQVFLVPLKGGQPMFKDGDRMVYEHEATLLIKPTLVKKEKQEPKK